MVLVSLIIVVAVLALWFRPWPLFPARKQLNDALGEQNVAVEFTQWVQKRARERGLNVRGVARRIPLKCPRCGGSSNYFVYPDDVCERCWRSSLKPRPPIARGRVSKPI